MGVLEDLPISDCKCTSFGAIRSIYIELRHHKDELLKGTTGGNRRIPRWRSLIIHRETKKFFGTLKSFFRSFISFFRSFISRLGGEFSFAPWSFRISYRGERGELVALVALEALVILANRQRPTANRQRPTANSQSPTANS